MNPLDRYLKAIRPFLPRAERDDILRELSENILAEIKDRETQLGRPLEDVEVEAILENHGSPLQLAGRYRRSYRSLSVGRELIGPELFPHYVTWLCLVVGLTAAMFAIAALVTATPSILWRWLPVAGIQFAVITLIMIGVEWAQKRHRLLDRWKEPAVPPEELLRRYLHALRFWLPKPDRDDILAEIAEDLRSRFESREAELGRPLDESEAVVILKQRGQPVQVASGYLRQRHLIGPELLPVYWFVLRVIILWVLIPVFAVMVAPAAIRASTNAALALGKTLWGLAMGSVFTIGVVTLVFAILERSHRPFRNWDPRKLPAVPPKKASAAPGPVSRYMAMAELVMSVAFCVGWIYVVRTQPVFDIEGVRLGLAPVWQSIFLPALGVLLLGAVRALAGLGRPSDARLRSIIHIVGNAGALALIAVLLNAGTWVSVRGPSPVSKSLTDAAAAVNLGVWITLLVLGIVFAVDIAQELNRVVRKKTAAALC